MREEEKSNSRYYQRLFEERLSRFKEHPNNNRNKIVSLVVILADIKIAWELETLEIEESKWPSIFQHYQIKEEFGHNGYNGFFYEIEGLRYLVLSSYKYIDNLDPDIQKKIIDTLQRYSIVGIYYKQYGKPNDFLNEAETKLSLEAKKHMILIDEEIQKMGERWLFGVAKALDWSELDLLRFRANYEMPEGKEIGGELYRELFYTKHK
ncbi:hypothetical protein GYA19_00350 [Candidatus Beckwithbacteria bacterium]|nr:hypothetical protein [Candidatus Beckwithbacteria bacterium]